MTPSSTPLQGNPSREEKARRDAEIRERERRAVQLVLEGKSYDEVAAELGYTHRATAWRTVQRVLARDEAESVADLRAVEGARYDALQAAWWAKAIGGDETAARIVLRIFQQRARLFGLNAPVVVQSGVPSEVDDEILRLVEQINAGGGATPVPTE